MGEKDRENFKRNARHCIEQHAKRTADANENALRRKQSDAVAVAATIQLLRADDEAVEETQRIAKQGGTLKTALYDERGNPRYSSTFSQYKNPVDDAETLWWPWGSSAHDSSICHSEDKMVIRARWLRGRVKQAADRNAAAFEAGTAFAQAAAAVHRSRRRKDFLSRTTTKEASKMAAALEEEARTLFRLASKESNPRLVLRRATDGAVVKEAVRRRTFMTPATVDEDVQRARRLHARALAAERRRQRARRADAYLTLFRDAVRSRGQAGFPTTRAVEPDVEVAAVLARSYLDLFCLDDLDATDSEDEEDYDDLCRRFCGKSADQRKQRPRKEWPDDSSGKRSRSDDDDDVQNSFKAAPTKEELLASRRASLLRVHDILSARGVRHLDNEFSDPSWIPKSDVHLAQGSLGALADLHREVLEESVALDGSSSLLPALAMLRAKAGNYKGAKEAFMMK